MYPDTLADRLGPTLDAFRAVASAADVRTLEAAFVATDARRTPYHTQDVSEQDPSTLARYIDHTVLKADATESEVSRVCREARAHRFASVCINGCFVPQAVEDLAGSGVAVCTVVGFPLGAMDTRPKAFEAMMAAEDGATEVDMVIPVGKLKSGRLAFVETDIKAVSEGCKTGGDGVLLKVIIECALLTEAEKVAACALAVSAGADFVKTSTGFAATGATEADVALMRQIVGGGIGVKAAGGIRSTSDAMAMIRAGASRIGASASVAIVGGGTSAATY